ncbi:hypothetical protein BG011_002034 [Mortierella polycephala]|uniref:Uncharacterized protein n=1 Tax=Mortierella polycephala TaxID=41804 RepID=A0A9P6Q6W9_9FUNG|nr:hypothetical protein BG011_002034 [Mortierella polycephala]
MTSSRQPMTSKDPQKKSTLYPHSVNFSGRPPPPEGGYSWEEIEKAIDSQSLHVLRRTDKGQYEYERWQQNIDRSKHENVGEYIALEILLWPDLKDPAERQDGADNLLAEERYKIIEPRLTFRLNHHPFPVQESIQYYVLWSTRDMSVLDERDRLEKYLQHQLGRAASPELIPPAVGKRKQWMWFVNPIELRSVASIHHLHVFVRDVDG